MDNVILITVLLTLSGVCLVGFLTWLGIASYRLMKFRKKAEGSLKHLERWIDDNNNMIQRRVDEVESNTQKNINDVYEQMSKNDIELNRRIDQVYPDIYRTVDMHVADLNSKIDSRSDKLQDKVDTNYKLLKEDHSKVDWLWKKVALNNNFLDVNPDQVKE